MKYLKYILVAILLFMIAMPSFAIGEEYLKYYSPGKPGYLGVQRGALMQRTVSCALPAAVTGVTTNVPLIIAPANIRVTNISVWYFTIPASSAAVTLDVLKMASGGSSGTSLISGGTPVSMLTTSMVDKTAKSLTLHATKANLLVGTGSVLYASYAVASGTVSATGLGGIVTVTYTVE